MEGAHLGSKRSRSVTAWFALALGATAFGGEQEEFEKGLARCESLMEQGQWRQAYDGLTALLAEHERQPYVLQQRARIEEDVKRSAFRVEVEVPAIERLVSGKVESYNRKTGEIKLRYTGGQLGDFRASKGMYIHSILFDGPYSVEIKGDSYPSTNGKNEPPAVYCGFENDEFLLISFGFERRLIGNIIHHHRAYIARHRGEENKVLDSKDTTPCKSEKPFSIKVLVGSTKVTAQYQGRAFLAAAKSKDVYGTVALGNLPQWTEIVVSGNAQPSWVQQIEDAAAQKALLEWEKKLDLSLRLPEWFVRGEVCGKAPEATVAEIEVAKYPGEESPTHDDLFRIASMYWNRGESEGGLIWVDENESRMSEVFAAFLRGRFHAELGDREAALRCYQLVAKQEPGFVEARREAIRLGFHDDPEQAEAALAALVEEYPRRADLALDLVKHLFRQGRLAEAQQAVGAAGARGVTSEDLEGYGRYLALATRGPDWTRRFEHSSRNYQVLSDIDVETCCEATTLLERAYAAFSTRLRPVPGLERRKFQVFLFAGQDGYELYVQRVLGGLDAYHTLGVYSGDLKQLFIWNQRDRRDMMRTVQHEGFHQYLDRVVEDAPPWFNEGLAEYYEVGGVEGTGWKEGQIHEENLVALQAAGRLEPLESFLYQDRDAFYAKPELHYPQAWALIHYLRHGRSETGRRFEELFEALADGTPAKTAVKRVFGKLDLKETDARFARYVEGLSG